MRVLIVGEPGSMHLARWVSQLKDTGWDVHIFQAVVHDRPPSEELTFGTLHVPFRQPASGGVTLRPTLPVSGLWRRIRARTRVFDKTIALLHSARLRYLIKHIKPDVVHSLALNVNWENLCAPVLEARKRLGRRFSSPWVYSSWGTDLDYYPSISEDHRIQVSAVLREVDYYLAECHRDVRLAREMGFAGELLGRLPAFGGVDVAHLERLRAEGRPSLRRTIYLKGRDRAMGGDPVGRALTALTAFAMCQDVLRGYRIVIGQPDTAVAAEATVLSCTTDLHIELLPRLPYDHLLRIIGASRVAMALTVNDGLPSTLVEAMALGSFPIHSNLEPIAEWVTDGENGLLVPPEDAAGVAAALRRALSDDAMVDAAAATNRELVRDHLSTDVVQPTVIDIYERVTR